MQNWFIDSQGQVNKESLKRLAYRRIKLAWFHPSQSKDADSFLAGGGWFLFHGTMVIVLAENKNNKSEE